MMKGTEYPHTYVYKCTQHTHTRNKQFSKPNQRVMPAGPVFTHPQAINRAMQKPQEEYSIGVLDIYGFEIFQVGPGPPPPIFSPALLYL